MAIDWARYKAIINNFQNEAFQDDIIWQRGQGRISRDGEDMDEVYQNITLKGLVQFNTFRTWPITMFTETGQEDKQSEVLWLNIAYLKANGWTDSYDRFDFDPARDRFIHRGQFYEPSGDTLAAQASDQPLLFMVVLKRLNIEGTIPSI